MTDKSEELKPCPFCGSRTIHILRPKHGGFYPYCYGCDMELEGKGTEAEAIDAWNTRTNSETDTLADELQMARKEAAMLREIAKSGARGVDWKVNLNATADFLDALRSRDAAEQAAAERERVLVEALEYYARPQTWRRMGITMQGANPSSAMQDEGERARQALASVGEKP